IEATFRSQAAAVSPSRRGVELRPQRPDVLSTPESSRGPPRATGKRSGVFGRADAFREPFLAHFLALDIFRFERLSGTLSRRRFLAEAPALGRDLPERHRLRGLIGAEIDVPRAAQPTPAFLRFVGLVWDLAVVTVR